MGWRHLGLIAMIGGCGFHPFATPDAQPVDAPRIDAPWDAPASLIIEAENFTSKTMPHTYDWAAETDATASGGMMMHLLGGDGGVCPSVPDPTIQGCSAAMIYHVDVPANGSYYFHIKMWADSGSVDSAFVGIDSDASAMTVGATIDSAWRWNKPAATFVVTAGAHDLYIWHREGGARVDELALLATATPPP